MGAITARQIKIIHACKGALKLSDEDYRAILAGYGACSSKDLDALSAARLLADLEAKAAAAGVWKQGGAPKRKGKRPFAKNAAPAGKEALLAKVEALLTEAGRPWAYADGMARHMFGLDAARFATPDQLHRIVAALVYDQKRRARRGP